MCNGGNIVNYYLFAIIVLLLIASIVISTSCYRGAKRADNELLTTAERATHDERQALASGAVVFCMGMSIAILLYMFIRIDA